MSKLFDFASIERTVESRAGKTAQIGERNRLMDKLFVEDVKRAGWSLLGPGQHLKAPTEGRAVVIGAVVWNKTDQELLQTAAALLAGETGVFIVNFDQVHSPADLDAVMPGVPVQTDTPVVAAYQDGVLTRVAVGQEAYTLLTPSGST